MNNCKTFSNIQVLRNAFKLIFRGLIISTYYLTSSFSFQLLDDMFERAASANESVERNYIKKHAMELASEGVERPAARLFSNPPGDCKFYLWQC